MIAVVLMLSSIGIVVAVVPVGLLNKCYWCEDLFVEQCTASYPDCETIWNTDVQYGYRELIAGTANNDQLQMFCRFKLFIV